MAYTITDATVGGAITAGGYNQITNLLKNSPVCRVGKSAAQTTSSSANTDTGVIWDLETYDPQTIHDNVTNPTRVTIPAGWSGYYSLKTSMRFVSSANYVLKFAVNGTALLDTTSGAQAVSGVGAYMTLATDYFLNAGDYVEVFMQSSVVNATMTNAFCSFSLSFIHI